MGILEFAIMGLITAIVGGIINYSSQQSANQANIDAQKNQLAQQNEYAKEQAEQANKLTMEQTRTLYYELYSPQAKVKQYEAAGLNPGLMYANGGGGGGISVAQAQQAATPNIALPNMIAPQLNLPNIMDYLQQAKNIEKTGQETKQIEANIDQIRANIDKTYTQIEEMYSNINLTNIKAQGTQIENAILTVQKDIAEATKETNIKIIEQNYQNMLAEYNKYCEELKGLAIENKWKDTLLENQNKLLLQQIKNGIANEALARAQTAVAEAEKKFKNSLTGMNEEERDRKKQQFEQNKKLWNNQITYSNQQINYMAEQIEKQSKENNWYEYNEILKGIQTYTEVINATAKVIDAAVPF